MPRYERQPGILEAFRYGIQERPEWFLDCKETGEIVTYPTHCEVRHPEGSLRCEHGDWLVKWTDGAIYPLKDWIFRVVYTPADGSEL